MKCCVSNSLHWGWPRLLGPHWDSPAVNALLFPVHAHTCTQVCTHTHRHTPGAQEEQFPSHGGPLGCSHLKLLCSLQRSLESSKCSHCYYYKRLHRHMETHLVKTQVSWFSRCLGEQQGCLFCPSSRITDQLEYWGQDSPCLQTV